MRLPRPRGPLTAQLVRALAGDPDSGGPVAADHPAPGATASTSGTGSDGDAALALWIVHELHYRGFDDVDDRWEWSPRLAPLRHALETALEERLRARFAGVETHDDLDLVGAIEAMIEAHDGPSLARHVQRHATREETEELLRQRSVYHLKEADPTSWTVARLEAGPKAALLQVQYDEYGTGDPARLHHELFARGLADSGLDASYGAHVDAAGTAVLEQNGALSLFGLHRRLRGASVGHLAAFEATSSIPSRQLAQGLRRLGFPESMAGYYDEHVEADAVHEQLVLRDVCGRLVAAEPEQRHEVLLGVWSCLDLESRTAHELLGRWQQAAA